MTVKLKRIGPGMYETADGEYDVVRYADDGEGTPPWWGWNKRGQKVNDAFPTKRDCVIALEDHLFRSTR